MAEVPTGSSFFQRFLLPGFAFKAVVIGGGYATGRELVEYFLPNGPIGGLMAMGLAMLIWSIVCSLTFVIAFARRSHDYRSFFRGLLGPFWLVFELAYAFFIIVLLSVFAAAAGAIGGALFGWVPIIGTLCLMAGISMFATFGNDAVERLFKYVSIFLYIVYALFVLLSFSRFGDLIAANFTSDIPTGNWIPGGLTYASYNVVGAVIILPVVRHLTSRRDAVIAGLLAGPLAMLPALLFFVAMVGFYPEISGKALPSDYILGQIGSPLFHFAFQLMIFAALLESGTGSVHTINERIAAVHRSRSGRDLPKAFRLAVIVTLLIVSVFVADAFGLIALIASGYRLLAWVILAVYLLPLFTIGLWQLKTGRLNPTPST
ncbi:hypothetical protein BH09PSE3_BH09PSE3_21580 [soil metagenome]